MSQLTDTLRGTLIDVARLSILSAVHATPALEPRPEAYPEPLRAERASFVTLHARDELRGCCGTLEPRRALVLDVWQSARAAACEDRRFEPVHARELKELKVEISILTPLARLVVANEKELLAQARPQIDGLYLRAGARRATFLPKVWESLKEPEEFLRQLKLKAGLEADYWSNDMEWFTYTTQSFGADFATETTCH